MQNILKDITPLVLLTITCGNFTVKKEVANFHVSKEKIEEILSDTLRETEIKFKEQGEQEKNKRELLSKFKAGFFDNIIFADKPELTEELKIIIASDNRTFMRKLLSNCTSEKTFDFWLQKGAKLPDDVLALAVMLNSKKFIFEHLHKNDLMPEIGDEDKVDFLERAKGKLNTESFEYIKKITDINENSYKL